MEWVRFRHDGKGFRHAGNKRSGDSGMRGKGCQACRKADGVGGFRHEGKDIRNAGIPMERVDSRMPERVSGMQEARGSKWLQA